MTLSDKLRIIAKKECKNHIVTSLCFMITIGILLGFMDFLMGVFIFAWTITIFIIYLASYDKVLKLIEKKNMKPKNV